MTDHTNVKPYEIAVLDGLIRGCYKAILVEVEKSAKLGDLLKMIELRRKLTPNEEDQKQFWSMLESVRRKQLAKSAHEEASLNSKTGNKKRSQKGGDVHE